ACRRSTSAMFIRSSSGVARIGLTARISRETIVIVIRNGPEGSWVVVHRGVSVATPQLQVRNLSKTFPGTRALRSVDLEVAPGEVHAPVGASGSGKSTRIKILAGVHEPDPGASAEVRGEPFELGSVTAADRAGLRFVHQDTGLVHSLDAADNIALGRSFETRAFGAIDWRRQCKVAR